MKLKRIKVENFGGIDAVDLAVGERTTFLTGLNGSGKTTTLRALHQLVFGACYDQSGKRIQLGTLIGPRAAKATVQAEWETTEGTELHALMTIQASGCKGEALDASKTILATGIKDVRELILKHYGVDPRYLECTMNPKAYLLSEDLAELLGSFLVPPSPEELVEYAGSRGAWLAAWLQTHFPRVSALDVAAIGKKAATLRTDVNKQLAAAEAAVEELCGTEVPKDRAGKVLTEADAPRLQAFIAETNAKYEAAKRQLEELRGIDPDAVEAKGREASELLTALEAEKKEREAAAEEQRARLAERSNALEAVKQEDAQARHDAHIAREEVKRAEAALRELGDPEGACPLCAAKYTEARRKKVFAPLQATIERAQAAADVAGKKVQELMDRVNVVRGEISKEQDALRSEESELSILDRKIGECAMTLSALPDLTALPDPVAVELAMKEFAERRDRAIETENKLARRVLLEQAESTMEQRAAETENLTWCVKQFRDGAYQASKLGDAKGDFEAHCNRTLEDFGMQLQVGTAGGEVVVQVSYLGEGRGHPVNAAQLSKGELVLVQWAVARAFQTRAPIILDDVDALDGQNKARLMRQLKVADQPVILSGAWGQTNQDITPLKQYLGGSVSWFENGANWRNAGCGA